MDRKARFFIAVGVLNIILSLVPLFNTPYDPDYQWSMILSWFVAFSAGLTQIAVGWLLDQQLRK